MSKRTCWLLVAILLPLLMLVGFGQVEGMMGETAVVVSPSFVINEIHADPDIPNGDANGDGTRNAIDDEFVEMINQSGKLVSIGGWEIHDDDGVRYIFPENTIVPDGCAVVVFGGGAPTGEFGGSIVQTASGLSLKNSGDSVILHDSGGTAVISYTYGTKGGDNQSLTRDPDITGDDPLVKHSTVTNASGALFSPGTRTDGSSFASCQPPPMANIQLEKNAPLSVQPGELLTYSIQVENIGSLTAANSILTDSLPSGMTYVADTSGFSMTQSDAQTVVWQMGTVLTETAVTFDLTVLVSMKANGWLTNTITASTITEEFFLENNKAEAATYIGSDAVLLDAVLPDGWTGSNHADEAVSLRNMGDSAVNLDGWQLNDKALPLNMTLLPGEVVWLTKDAVAFTQQFGFAPDSVLASWPGLTNDGDEVSLSNNLGQVVDVLVYGDGDTGVGGWSGTAVQPFPVSGKDGQILYRMRDQITGQIVPDTNTTADWAQSLDDMINGRKVRYPGWDLDAFFYTTQVTETAVLTIAIAPDNAYEAVVNQIDSATTSVQAESLTLENTALADAFIRAAGRGVSVTLLLEGGIAGGVTHQEHYLCQQLINAGGLCAFMINDGDSNISARYDYLHAKFMLIDGERVIVSTQNLSPNSLPADDKNDGTWGRRGVVLITDASQVVAHVQTIFDRDYDFAHQDIVTGVSHLVPLPIGFIPITQTGGTTYTVRYPQPVQFSGVFPFEIVQSPENSLRDVDGLLGLVNQAGEGDVVLVQQMYERPFWGASSSNAIDDPNPRLEAYLDAARRGARVRILLDEFFDTATAKNSNAVTCAHVREIAKQEHLRLECAIANPTGLGIHNKMVLVQIDGQGYIHVGSINGSETSNKANRELALQVQSNEAYAYLADMFDHDWPYRVYLPLILNNVMGPADHILISEIQYNPPGLDDKEFVELVNPTTIPVDMSAYSLGDAVNREDFEDVRRFPAGTVLPPRQTIVIATSAAAFFAEFGFYPDFEILETVTAVPNLIDDPMWGDPATFFQLGNSGDEIILRDVNDQVIDVVSYGEGNYPDVTSCPSVTTLGAVLERFPYWQDTDDCASDFREWPYPSPGTVE